MPDTTLSPWQCLTFSLLILTTALSQAQQSPTPRLESATLPRYPPIAVAAHITGKVIVALTVSGGRVTATDLAGGSSYPDPEAILNKYTVLNVKSWRFGDTVNEKFTVTYTYEFASGFSDEPTNPKIEITPNLDVKMTARQVKPTCMDGPCP